MVLYEYHNLVLFYTSIERSVRMAEVRKDHKGRRLFPGESQRKDGKYEYKYQDSTGKRK